MRINLNSPVGVGAFDDPQSPINRIRRSLCEHTKTRLLFFSVHFCADRNEPNERNTPLCGAMLFAMQIAGRYRRYRFSLPSGNTHPFRKTLPTRVAFCSPQKMRRQTVGAAHMGAFGSSCECGLQSSKFTKIEIHPVGANSISARKSLPPRGRWLCRRQRRKESVRTHENAFVILFVHFCTDRNEPKSGC